MKLDADARIRLMSKAMLRGELVYPGLDDPMVCRQRGLRLMDAVERNAPDDELERHGGFTTARIHQARREQGVWK